MFSLQLFKIYSKVLLKMYSISHFLQFSSTGPVLYMLSVPNTGRLFKSTTWEHYSTVFWTISPFFSDCAWSRTASYADCFMQLHYSPPDAASTEDHSACCKVRASEVKNTSLTQISKTANEKGNATAFFSVTDSLAVGRACELLGREQRKDNVYRAGE